MVLVRYLFLLFVSVTCIFFSSFSQSYLLRTKGKVEKKFKKYTAVNKATSFVYATDSTVRLSVQDSAYRKMDLTCYFDTKGKCFKQTRTTDCDDCFEKYFSEIRDTKMYKWKKINDSLFLSNTFWQTALIVDSSAPFSFTLIHGYHERKKHALLYRQTK